MRVPVQDQTYVISRHDYFSKSDPGAGKRFWVDAHTDTLYVRCLSEDAEEHGVDLEVHLLPIGLDDDELHQWDSSWDATIVGEWDVTQGPVVAATLEQEEVAQLFQNGGRYRFLYLARRARDPEPGDPLEEHVMFTWELDDHDFADWPDEEPDEA